MTLMDIISRRHSVRSYLDKPVERAKIELCLEAARLAPSASNSQPWRFVVVDEPGLKDRLCDAAFTGLSASMKFPRQAPVIVAAIARRRSSKSGWATWHSAPASTSSTWALREHFALQAAELGWVPAG